MMNKLLRISMPVILALFPSFILGSDTAGFSVHTRPSLPLNGAWNYIVDPYENGYYNYRREAFDQLDQAWSAGYYADRIMANPGDLIEYNFNDSPTLHVPGDWNTQDEKLYYYEGTIWYRKIFDDPERQADDRVYLYFGAANYRADVYLNAEKLGVHIGGFTPFWFDITENLREGNNSLVVRVDNTRCLSCVPTVNTDWWNYGGLTREVKLIILPKTHIRDFTLQLESNESKKIKGKVFMENATYGEKIDISIPELNIKTSAVTSAAGTAEFELIPEKLELWSPEHPKRYVIRLNTETDKFQDTVAFRTVSVQGKQVLLNGKPVFLRGISIHEEYSAEREGRVNAAWKAEKLLRWAKDLECNFVRLAHYPHNEDMIRTAERMGIMVWSEVPVYWTIDWENEETYHNARTQLTENILRDRNRANIIIWSLANETPVTPERTRFLKDMATHARSLDPSRLLSAAMEKHYINDSTAVVEDPLSAYLDIISFNEYIGWYDGLPEKCDRVKWEIGYDKPVFVSEFGGGAKYGHHGSSRLRWTEEFQEDLYTRSLKMLDQIDGLCGMSPWILCDFRSPRRPLPKIQDDFNRKGVLSEKGEKKKAYHILQQYYRNKK